MATADECDGGQERATAEEVKMCVGKEGTMVAVADEWRLRLYQTKGNSGGTQEVTMEKQRWMQQAAGRQEATGMTMTSKDGRH